MTASKKKDIINILPLGLIGNQCYNRCHLMYLVYYLLLLVSILKKGFLCSVLRFYALS